MAETIPVFPDPYKRLLLVEGNDDASFFYALLRELDLAVDIYIYDYQGSEKLDMALSNVVQDRRFEELVHLGIARDADFNIDAFSRACSSIERANRVNPRHQLPIPQRHMESQGDQLKVTVCILPDSDVDGMLEDLILEACLSDPAMSCVEDYFRCLQDNGISLKDHVLPKAKTRVYIAGKAADETGTKNDKETWEPQYIFRRPWWSWGSPVFDQVKAFLHQLAES